MSNYSLHDLPAEERPRERLQRIGVENLSLQELLAIIIEKGGRNQNVLEISQNLLSRFGNLKAIKRASLEELKKVKGVGVATACKLKTVFQLGEKVEQPVSQPGKKLNSAGAVFHFLRRKIGSKKREHFFLLSLDSRGCLIKMDKVSIGSLTTSISHPREVFKFAIRNSANSVVLAHNHPSGDPQPSSQDVKLSKRLAKAGKMLGIKVADHIIVTKNDYFSLACKGMI